MSQARLAELAHTSQPQIDRLEKGQRKMTKEWALRLARPLECHWLELMEAAPLLSPRELALVELYRGLSEENRETVFRVADAMAEQKKRAANGG